MRRRSLNALNLNYGSNYNMNPIIVEIISVFKHNNYEMQRPLIFWFYVSDTFKILLREI